MYTLLGLFVVMVLSGVLEYILISNGIREGIFFNIVEWIMICTGGLMHLFLVITSIWYLRWVYKTNQGLRALGEEEMCYSAGWVVGWYFVPLMNLFKPYLVMKEIWLVSHRHVSSDYKLVKCWWGFWIASSIGSYYLTLELSNGESWAEYLELLIISSIVFSMNIVVLVVSLKMIKQIAPNGIGITLS